MLQIELQHAWESFQLSVACSIDTGWTAIFGPSGAGKSTILQFLAGLQHPQQGRIVYHGDILLDTQTGVNIPPQNRNIGYVFQESRLFPHMTVRQNLEYALRHTPQDKQRFGLADMVQQLGITPLLARRTRRLSGGEKQRVALARTLLSSPRLLLLDEPFAALDQATKWSFLALLQQLQRQHKLPIVYVSHDLGSVLHFADQVIVLEQGRMMAQGHPLPLLRHLVQQPAGQARAIPNILNAQVAQQHSQDGLTAVTVGSVQLLLPALDYQPGEHLLLQLLASDIILANQRPVGVSACNVLPAKLVSAEQMQGRLLLVVDIGVGVSLFVEVTTGTLQKLQKKLGDEVFLLIKASAFAVNKIQQPFTKTTND